MRPARIAARPLLVALLAIGPATGCFVGSELDQANATASGAAAKSMNPSAPAAKPGAPAAAEGAPSGAASASNKPAAPSGPSWWKTARTLSSESSDSNIMACDLNGRIEFMHREDCLARGGRAK